MSTKTQPRQTYQRDAGDSSDSGKKPVFEYRLGRIVAAVWENESETEESVWYSVSITRIYKEGSTWKRSTTYGRDDLPLVQKVASHAHDWIYQHVQAA